jgi:hypothetical protein
LADTLAPHHNPGRYLAELHHILAGNHHRYLAHCLFQEVDLLLFLVVIPLTQEDTHLADIHHRHLFHHQAAAAAMAAAAAIHHPAAAGVTHTPHANPNGATSRT